MRGGSLRLLLVWKLEWHKCHTRPSHHQVPLQVRSLGVIIVGSMLGHDVLWSSCDKIILDVQKQPRLLWHLSLHALPRPLTTTVVNLSPI
jgi:hypothetical protein